MKCPAFESEIKHIKMLQTKVKIAIKVKSIRKSFRAPKGINEIWIRESGNHLRNG